MPINQNDDRPNLHTIVLGQSGSGKTYWLKHHPLVKKRGARVIVWDPYETHEVHYSKTRADFAREAAAALRSRKGFKLGLSVNPTEQGFEYFNRVAWTLADGRKTLVVVIEELADVTGSGKAKGTFSQLIRVGRKYGVVVMAATQRPQEIPKTLFTQVSRKWCGYVDPFDRTYCERHMGLDRGSLGTIAPGSYQFAYLRDGKHAWGGPRKKVMY